MNGHFSIKISVLSNIFSGNAGLSWDIIDLVNSSMIPALAVRKLFSAYYKVSPNIKSSGYYEIFWVIRQQFTLKF